MKSLLRNWALALLHPVPLLRVPQLWPYFRDWRAFEKRSGRRLSFSESYPCLNDAVATTPFDPHYFRQSAWLARRLAEARPEAHVDIGSSIDVIAVIAAFIPTTFVDVRPLPVNLSNLTSLAGDITALDMPDRSVASLSCLHVIEHIGLGRYGDPVDPEGARKAAGELQRVLAPGGTLYLSTPIGAERICFNAHRVSAPETVLAWFSELALSRFSYVDDDGALHENADVARVPSMSYGCGLFEFSRPPAAQ